MLINSKIVDGALLHGSYMCSFLKSGEIPAGHAEMKAENGQRLWRAALQSMPELKSDTSEFHMEPRKILDLVAYTSANFIANLSSANRDLLAETLRHFCCNAEASELIDLHMKMHVRVDDAPTVAKLFRSSSLSWTKLNDSSRLVVQLPKVISCNLGLFECTSPNEIRYARQVLESPAFQRRWGTTCALLKDRGCEPYLDAKGLKADIMAFGLFVRCCKGAASDYAVANDTIRDSFLELGNLEEVSRCWERALKSDASQEEQASFGINAESQRAALDLLHQQLQATEEHVTLLEEHVQQHDNDIREHGSCISELQQHSIPPTNRLYICGYLDERVDYDQFSIDRLAVLKIFGSLVCEKLGAEGIRDTVATEPTDYGHRNVYDNRKHLSAFEHCLPLLPTAIELRFSNVTMQEFFNAAMNKEDKMQLLRDIGQPDLANATTDKERATVIVNRSQSLFFVFRKAVQVHCEMHSIPFGSRMILTDWDKLFTEAKITYNSQREAKVTKAAAKAAAKAEKAAAKAAAKVNTRSVRARHT
jgi:hypothetical protein